MAARVVGAVAVDNAALVDDLTIPVPTSGATAVQAGDLLVLLATVIPNGSEVGPFVVDGFTTQVPQSTHGSMRAQVLTRVRQAGDGDVRVVWASGARLATHVLAWVRGADAAALVVGAVGRRTSAAPTVTTAPGLTAAADDLVLTLAWERTTAAETALTGVTGTEQVFFKPGNGNASNSGFVGQRTTTAAGTTPDAVMTYPNSQGSNGGAVQLRVPAAAVAQPEPTPEPAPAVTASPWVSSTAPDALQVGWLTTGLTTGRASVALASDPGTEVASAALTVAPSGWCTARVTGLQQDTAYRVTLVPAGATAGVGAATARTTATGLRPSVVLTSSCQRTGSDAVVFDRMRAEGADFFAHQGDVHYENTNVESTWREGYRRSLTAPRFAALLATLPVPFAWDNHDTGGNGSNGGDPWATFGPPALRELLGTADYRSTKGLERTWVHAGVRYVQPDRWAYRDDQDDASTATKTMYGPEQLAWFLDLLSTATEPVIVWLSGFPLYDIAAGRWGSYPAERNKIRDHIAGLPAAQRAKIVAVAGDSHAVHADDGTNALFGVPSLNASPLDQSGGLPSGTWNIGNLDVPDDRGYYSRLTFTPDEPAGVLRMRWDAVQDDGAVVMTWSKPFPLPGVPTWSEWDGARERPLTVDGAWSGAAIAAAVTDRVT